MIEKNLIQINQRIRDICRKCGRNPDEITLVAISKMHTPVRIEEAYRAGLRHFGENRVQELLPKMDGLPEDIQWHMVGPLQSNKIKSLVHGASWIQSVSQIRHLKELEKRFVKAGRTINVLIQVNISGETQKSGCEPEELPVILKEARRFEKVRVKGLMGMATLTEDREQIRREFRLLRSLRDEHISLQSDSILLKELSMGMSDDFDLAIEEGATMIRLGSSVFGPRPCQIPAP